MAAPTVYTIKCVVCNNAAKGGTECTIGVSHTPNSDMAYDDTGSGALFTQGETVAGEIIRFMHNVCPFKRDTPIFKLVSIV